MKKISILGATGSIGLQTVEVIEEHPDQFQLTAIAFGKNIEKAIPIIQYHRPKTIVVADHDIKEKLTLQIDVAPQHILVGEEGLIDISCDREIDLVVNAVMGSMGLPATIAAIEAQKQIAFANKETLVTAGHLVMEKAKEYNVNLLPVDSEHSAIFQALNGEDKKSVNQIILTASGGSFRDKTRADLSGVTVNDALNHPNWDMGAKITIDSATMMNKGLEVIEAHWLFDIPYEKIDVVQHRESVIHSMIEYVDRSVIAQLGTPDMRVPIQYALTYPERLSSLSFEPLDVKQLHQLHFQELDMNRFPMLRYAYEAGKKGGSMPTVLNAANEVAVALFLQEKITFLEIETIVEHALQAHRLIQSPDLETINQIDQETRIKIDEAHR
ncbi:1-deoxy-D-xylulose 5-phosphate reductoisomerase [Gracilibacillus halophilus YIM-C55.5]|uniref:1-deoxy-D-xylulose 5-phosphate reductoisomerase n=1 Tax=Gracilibacillus halophilus YIM-C55.5 TaxID=1308866 RepID=N4WQ37_9BACI|nr:1-deoxy-D-xylulose-5-phosphate reductoisomerase [Gracilibacillus halophilus]ENH96555.1 1-deoxy-D-xylulose 5-phosphate reductoisomerase [Gracilibacillus halophilus YIM-C55.5]